MREKDLSNLTKKKLIVWLVIIVPNNVVLDPYNHCLVGKHHKVSLSTSSRRRLELLSLVHSNVCGPLEEESLDGNNYILTFIDDAYPKVQVYFLRKKNQVLKYFKLFYVMVDYKNGTKLKCLCPNNEGEYTSRKFDAYCSRHNVRHEKTISCTPQHNRVAKIMNRTIMERVKNMVCIAKMPKPF